MASTVASEPTLPINENFERAVASPWSLHVSGDNSVQAKEGVLRIDAYENTFAHIARPLGIGHVSATATIRPSSPPGVTWATSMFLLWNDANWCQIGVKAAGSAGAYYIVETKNSATTEIALDPCTLDQWHHLRIELGADHIRYYYSTDGKSWKVLRTTLRPTEYASAPSTLVLGKGFGKGAPPYGNPGLQNDYAERGQRGVSLIDNLSVVSTPKKLLTLPSAERSRLQMADRDPVGRSELVSRDDPTFDSVAGHYPPIKYPKEAVGVAEHPLEICVDHLGRLTQNYDQKAIAQIAIGDEAVPFAVEGSTVTRRLHDGYKPIVELKTDSGGQTLAQTVFGASDGFSPDKPLIAYVRMTVTATDDSALPSTAWLISEAADTRNQFPLVPSGPRTAEVCLRFEFPKPETAAVISSSEFQHTLDATSSHWGSLIRAGAIFDLPDTRLNEAYRAWLAYSLLLVDKINGVYEPHDGAGFYEQNYGYSAALYCNALSMYGMHSRSQRYLESMLTFQQPDGLYVQNYGLPDQGSLLMALAENYNLSRDDAWLKRISPKIILAADWLLRQRELAPKSGPTKGLIKFRSYCDYSEPVYSYYSDAYCATGLARAARALAAIGLTEQADKYAREARSYRDDILASMEASVIHRSGRNILPMEPETHRLLKDGNYGAGDYYGCVASMLLETGLLEATDKRSVWITDHLENANGLLLGLCRFFEGGIDHAYTYGYLMTQIERGEPRKALLGMYAMLAYGMTRDTYSGVECTNAVTGQNFWTLPHLYSCTQQLRLLRNMIIREDGDTLRIGDAIPTAWLEDGKQIRVNQAPTAFGDVSLNIKSQVKTGAVEIRLTPPTQEPPERMLITLRHPRHAKLVGVFVDGRSHPSFHDQTIELTTVSKPVSIRAVFGD